MTAATGILIWLIGLCVGSFLNVVVYRLLSGLSIINPVFSMCPACRTRIAWFDNIPVVSWFALRGRCRACRAPISTQYPLIESLTGLAFVLVYFLLARDGVRVGWPPFEWPLDWAVLIGWLVLVAVLIAFSTTDVLLYIVDTRLAFVALVAGVLAYSAWQRPALQVALAQQPEYAAGATALCVGGLTAFLLRRRTHDWAEEGAPEPATMREVQHGFASASLAVTASTAIAVLLVFSDLTAAGAVLRPWMLGAALAMLFLVTALAGGKQREADDDIHAAVESESDQARRTVLIELTRLAPAILAAAGVYALLALRPEASQAWQRLVATRFAGGMPVAGAAIALHGAAVAASAGWFLRILFTLAFGREAFGSGDIYILAAAGACAGWDIALIGLVLAVGFALGGWIIALMMKRSSMIPFGPWLAIGFVAALWGSREGAEVAGAYLDAVQDIAFARPDFLLVGAGIILVSFGCAIFLGRMVRRAIEGGRGPLGSG